MNTKMKQIALPLVVVLAVLLAFSSPAAASYAGDQPLVTYEQQVIKGGIVFVTDETNSSYTPLQAVDNTAASPTIPKPILTQTLTVTGIPDGATIKMARLYNYYTWSTADLGDGSNPGMPAEADISFNGVTKVCQHGLGDGLANRSSLAYTIGYGNGVIQYWDTKGQGYTSIKYDNPSGTFAWDVTGLVTGNGVYIANITNNDTTPTKGLVTGFPPKMKAYKYWERFATYGFGLLVVYEDPDSPKIEYWIDEGCDLLLNTSKYSVYEPIATTSAPFDGVIHWGDPAHEPWDRQRGDLTAVCTSSDKWNETDWDESMNMVYFNSGEVGPSTAKCSYSIAMDKFVDVPLIHEDNIAYFQDRDLGTRRGDNYVVCNAFLVVEKLSKGKGN